MLWGIDDRSVFSQSENTTRSSPEGMTGPREGTMSSVAQCPSTEAPEGFITAENPDLESKRVDDQMAAVKDVPRKAGQDCLDDSLYFNLSINCLGGSLKSRSIN